MTDFEALLSTLARHDVAFIVIGGAAATAHGSARLVRALASTNPYLRGAPPGLPFKCSLVTSLGDIDLPGEIPGGGSYTALAELEGIEDENE